MSNFGALKLVKLFEGLGDEHLEQLCAGSEEVTLAPGETLFAENDAGDRAYVITGGELEIVKQAGERDVLLAVRRAPDVIGEMALLEASPRTATARARSTVTLLTIPKPALDRLLESSTTALRAMLDTVLGRLRENQALLQQGERMQQLGTLSAGVAHELNNPASGVQRSAAGLRESLAAFGDSLQALARLDLAASAQTEVDRLMVEANERNGRPADLDAGACSLQEAQTEDWLEAHDVPEPWALTSALANLELGPPQLNDLLAEFGPDALPVVLGAVVAAHEAHLLLHQVEEGAQRISAIVAALKGYSYLDQAPVQDVDVTVGIDNTLLILGAKLRGITVRREYADDLPRIEAYGSELNQVWTNLLDNAADALAESGRDDPLIVIRAAPEAGRPFVVVEIEDNGPGIPPEIRERIFDRFFTTKPPGSGTGLGLDTTQRIVVLRHRGDIRVESEPGRTVFRVELPQRLS